MKVTYQNFGSLWFPMMVVSEFEQGLREYQKKERGEGSYDWKEIIYRDGQSGYC